MPAPNDIQVALIYDRPVTAFDAIVRQCKSILEAKLGASFNTSEAKPNTFCRLFGANELMITLENVSSPPDMAVLAQPLSSPITALVCPDVRQRLSNASATILINVSHGVFGGVERDPKIAAFFEQIGYQRAGSGPEQFLQRLEILALLGRIAADSGEPSLVHWTQSNQLFPGESWDGLAALKSPSPLHIHPFLFGGDEGPDGQTLVGIRTFGARHFIDRELVIEPNRIPFADSFNVLLTFLAVATAPGGYLIPDGDTFGLEDGAFSYRAVHLPEQEGEVPVIELRPLMYGAHDFLAPDYVPKERAINDRAPPASIMPADDEEKMELANEWREKRRLAEGIGGRLEIRARGTAPLPPMNSGPPRPGTFGRAVFGRKKA